MKKKNKSMLFAVVWLLLYSFGCLAFFLMVLCGCETRSEYNWASLHNHNNEGTDYTITRDYYDGVMVHGWNGYVVTKDYEVIREDDGSIKVVLTLKDILDND